MPYIKNDNNRRIELVQGDTAQNAGELNFQIFNYVLFCIKMQEKMEKYMIVRFVEDFLGEKRNYQKYNDLAGCLICCHKELERRFGITVDIILEVLDSYDKEIGDYEDIKIAENNDV